MSWERFKLVDGGKTLEALITIEDPGAFNMKWSAVQRWTRRENRPIIELICAENPNNYFNLDLVRFPRPPSRIFERPRREPRTASDPIESANPPRHLELTAGRHNRR